MAVVAVVLVVTAGVLVDPVNVTEGEVVDPVVTVAVIAAALVVAAVGRLCTVVSNKLTCNRQNDQFSSVRVFIKRN